MNIGIDIDDTITNSFETIFADSQKFDIEVAGNDGNLKFLGKVDSHYYIENIYNWNEKQCEEFWTKYFNKALKEAKPRDYAKKVIQKLKQEGNKIYIITSRYEDEIYPNVIKNTKEWFAKNEIPYDELVINSQNKAKSCREKEIDLFIDDSIAHCRSIQKEGIKTFTYTTMMNEGIEIEKEGLTRVYSWPQIYKKYQEIKNKRK